MNTALTTVVGSVLLAASLGTTVPAAPVTTVASESGNYFRHMPAGGAYYWSSSVATGDTVGPVVWDDSNPFNGTTYNYRDYYVFDLPALGYGSGSITGVTLKITETNPSYFIYAGGSLNLLASASATNNSGTNYGTSGVNVPVNPAYGTDAGTAYTDYSVLAAGSYNDGPKTFSIDVTDAVKAAYAGGQNYMWFTLYVTAPSNVAWQSWFATQNNATAAYRPQLEIVPEPAALSLLALGALAALGRRRR